MSETSVADVLSSTPEAARVFLALGTACVGCYLARFCTLEEVAAAYNLGLDPFLKNLHEVIQSKE